MRGTYARVYAKRARFLNAKNLSGGHLALRSKNWSGGPYHYPPVARTPPGQGVGGSYPRGYPLPVPDTLPRTVSRRAWTAAQRSAVAVVAVFAQVDPEHAWTPWQSWQSSRSRRGSEHALVDPVAVVAVVAVFREIDFERGSRGSLGRNLFCLIL